MAGLADRAKELFLDALELSDQERGAFVDEGCRGDPELRERVDALLAAHGRARDLEDRSGSWLGSGGSPVSPGVFDDGLETGACIGAYRLGEQLGEGGFGTVWRAEQQQPVRRWLALKVLKAGLETREVVARFEAERQALALMDHPSIARVYDAGDHRFGPALTS